MVLHPLSLVGERGSPRRRRGAKETNPKEDRREGLPPPADRRQRGERRGRAAQAGGARDRRSRRQDARGPARPLGWGRPQGDGRADRGGARAPMRPKGKARSRAHRQPPRRPVGQGRARRAQGQSPQAKGPPHKWRGGPDRHLGAVCVRGPARRAHGGDDARGALDPALPTGARAHGHRGLIDLALGGLAPLRAPHPRAPRRAHVEGRSRPIWRC